MLSRRLLRCFKKVKREVCSQCGFEVKQEKALTERQSRSGISYSEKLRYMLEVINLKLIRSVSTLCKYISAVTLFLMMLVITLSVILRTLDRPLLGDYIIVELLMVILVATGLAYTQQIKGHIAIGLLVDRFSKKRQEVLDIIAYFLTFLVCIFTSIVNLIVGINRFEDQRLLQIVNIPIYPFIFIVALGFLAWGLVALSQLIKTATRIRDGGLVDGD